MCRYPVGNYRVPLLIVEDSRWENEDFYHKALARNAVYKLMGRSGVASDQTVEGEGFGDLVRYLNEEINLRRGFNMPEIDI